MADVIIPLYKPDNTFYELLRMIFLQTIKPGRIILINTEEKGYSAKDVETGIKNFIIRYKYKAVPKIDIINIDKIDFDHGKTRHMASKLSKSDYIIFMTQDAIPKDKFLIEQLLFPFKDEQVAVVYARQIAKEESDMIEKYTRIFNYPKESMKKIKSDLNTLGIKTFFSSNVCAAYKKSLYDKIGGFNKKMIFNEDMLFAANVINSGYAVYYNAEAVVYHSHSYSWVQQFKRNFDIGVSQKKHSKIFKDISSEKEGITFVKKLLKLLKYRREYLLAADFIIQCIFKYTGYFFGKNYNILPKNIIMLCTMNKGYW